MNPEIAILLCVYNSEQYLPELLDSLFSQTYHDFGIYVHDDGSTDSTLEILEEYRKKYGQIELLPDNKQGRKAMGSFVWLLEQVEDARYYMFCDHDDVWLPDKVALSLEKMRQCEAEHPGCPVVVNTDLCVVDDNLKELHPSFWKYSGIDRKLSSDFNHLTVCNSFTGCTMILNREVRAISLPISEQALMHDKWIALKVAAHPQGVLGYVDKATILYRQHGDNVVGANQVNGRYYMRQIKHLKATIDLNRRTLAMSRAIRPFSCLKYIYYKLEYSIRKRP